MRISQQPKNLKCPYCHKSFKPHVRLKARQQTCGEAVCRREHRRRYQKKYRKLNPGCEKKRDPAYYRMWRSRNPKYVFRNRFFTALRKRMQRLGLQRKLDILQFIEPSGYFERYSQFATYHRSSILEFLGRLAA